MPELVELARIQGVKGYRARQLFNAGLRTIRDVAESDPSTLQAIFNRGKLLQKQLQNPNAHQSYHASTTPACTTS